MEKVDLVLLLARLSVKYTKEIKKGSNLVTHHSKLGEVNKYLITPIKLIITYTPHRMVKEYKFDSYFVETDSNNKHWFYGFSHFYNHTVYIHIDEDFLNSITKIERI